jgi:hypothetical protein
MDQLFPVHPKKSPAAYKLRTVEQFSQHVAVYADIQQ